MADKNLTIWVCEDDEASWDCQREALEEHYPGCSVRHFENAGYTIGVTGSPDFIIVDVGGMMGLGCDIIALTRANVEGMSEEHPGAIFILFSAVGCYAEESYEAIKSDLQACSEWMDGCDFHRLIKEHIDKWL